jgi:hypothetical protein
MAKKARVYPRKEFPLHVNGQDYLILAQGKDTFHVFGRTYVCEFEIISISREGWDGKCDFKDVAETIYNDPDLFARVCDVLSEMEN